MHKYSGFFTMLSLGFALLLAACSSDSSGDVVDELSGEGGSQSAASRAGTTLMMDTDEYQITQEVPMTMEISSTVFSRIRRIPIEYTCTKNYWYPESGFIPRYGEDKSPPLAWDNIPDGTQSFAIIVDDPDAVEHDPGVVSPRVHWLIWNIPAEVEELAEKIATTTEVFSVGPNTRQGINDYDQIGWSGPCPPPNVISIHSRDDHPGGGKRTQYPHAYVFSVYALDVELDLTGGSTKNDLLESMDGHILAKGQLSGEYINKKLYK